MHVILHIEKADCKSFKDVTSCTVKIGNFKNRNSIFFPWERRLTSSDYTNIMASRALSSMAKPLSGGWSEVVFSHSLRGQTIRTLLCGLYICSLRHHPKHTTSSVSADWVSARIRLFSSLTDDSVGDSDQRNIDLRTLALGKQACVKEWETQREKKAVSGKVETLCDEAAGWLCGGCWRAWSAECNRVWVMKGLFSWEPYVPLQG